MRFVVKKDRFSGIMAMAYRVTKKASNLIPWESLLLLRADEDKVTVTVQTMGLSGKFTADGVQVAEPGEVLVPAKILADFVAAGTGDTIDVSTNTDEKLLVQVGSSRVSLNTLNVASYPTLGTEKPNVSFTLPAQALCETLRRVAFAAAKSHPNKVFEGVLLEAKPEDSFSLVATNSHRLAAATLDEADLAPSNECRVVIPANTVDDIANIFHDTDGDILIDIGKSSVLFATAQRQVKVMLINGTFPNWRDVIPTNCTTSITGNAKPFIEALRRIAIIPAEKDKAPMVVLRLISDHEMLLRASSELAGEITETVEIEAKRTDSHWDTVHFDTRYLLEGLSRLNSDRFCLEMRTPTTPALLSAGDSENGDKMRYVLVPLISA